MTDDGFAKRNAPEVVRVFRPETEAERKFRHASHQPSVLGLIAVSLGCGGIAAVISGVAALAAAVVGGTDSAIEVFIGGMAVLGTFAVAVVLLGIRDVVFGKDLDERAIGEVSEVEELTIQATDVRSFFAKYRRGPSYAFAVGPTDTFVLHLGSCEKDFGGHATKFGLRIAPQPFEDTFPCLQFTVTRWLGLGQWVGLKTHSPRVNPSGHNHIAEKGKPPRYSYFVGRPIGSWWTDNYTRSTYSISGDFEYHFPASGESEASA